MVSWLISSYSIFSCIDSIYGMIFVVIIIRMLFRFDLLRKLIVSVEIVSNSSRSWFSQLVWLLLCRMWVNQQQVVLKDRQVMNSRIVQLFMLVWLCRFLNCEYVSGRLIMIQVNRLVRWRMWVWLRIFNMLVFYGFGLCCVFLWKLCFCGCLFMLQFILGM